jgi:hypothetical protein
MLLTEIDVIDRVLHAHTAAIGKDIDGYRNHVYRVTNLCMALSTDETARVERIATAAVFHDIGIWTADTFDYLAPSIKQAIQYLAETGKSEWAPEITAMILEHHKVTPYRTNALLLVEPFRKADWVDVSWGAITHGLSRAFIRDLYAAWPDAGFHWKLVKLSADRLATHPWSPLPMVRF